MSMLTPIDFISSLASLNKGDVQGFRQPWSEEGRQQIRSERGLQTSDLEQKRRLMDYFASLPSSELPGAIANHIQSLTAQDMAARLPFAGPQAEATLGMTKAGTNRTQAEADATKYQTEQSRATDTNFAQPGVQSVLQKQTGIPAGNNIDPRTLAFVRPGEQFSQEEAGRTRNADLMQKAHVLTSLVQALPYLMLGDPKQLAAVRTRINELGGVSQTETPSGNNELADALRQWMGQKSQPQGTPSDTTASGGPLGFLARNPVNAPPADVIRNVSPDVREIAKPGNPIPANITREQLQQAMEMIRLLTQEQPGRAEQLHPYTSF